MWEYNGKSLEEIDLTPYVGFVYLIERLDNNKKYIGKKLLKFKKTKRKSSNKRRTSVLVDSDWKTYWGSNKELQNDVATLGEHMFKRTVLFFCRSKREMSYLELKEQILRDVLFSEEYYNNFIGAKIGGRGIKPFV